MPLASAQTHLWYNAPMTSSPQLTDYNLAYLLDLYDRYLENPAAVDAATRAFFATWAPEEAQDHAPPATRQAPPGEAAPAAATRAPRRSVAATPKPVRARPEPRAASVSPRAPAPAPGVESSPPRAPAPAPSEEEAARQLVAFVKLAQNIRAFGHAAAQLDPLDSPREGDSTLTLEYYGLTEDELRTLDDDIIGGPVTREARNAREALHALRRVYQGTTGHEYLQIRVQEERDWLRDMVETEQFYPPQAPIHEIDLLQRLTQVEAFERFLGRTFPGKTRFSIEGLDVMVPMMDELIGASADEGTRYVVVGMAHRGRLNILTHIMGKSYAGILAEFQDLGRHPHSDAADSADEGWSGDVKYHLGGVYTPPEARRRAVDGQVEMKVKLAPNPSHLEFVNPVVEGMARAAQTRNTLPGAPVLDFNAALPILIHGDAAFPGQGIVAETLNMYRLSGYTTGGTLHIIANNQIGFTTSALRGRSTTYASDLAKGFRVPIIHVNADDPVACIAAARLAHAYRTKFQKDFVIDLVGYRRWGHNEGDEPTFTQPRMYDRITQHPTVRALWAGQLIQRGIITEARADEMLQEAMDNLRRVYDSVTSQPYEGSEAVPAPRRAGHIETAVTADRLARLNADLTRLPDSFHLNPKLRRVMDRRHSAFEASTEGGIDWGHAEALAFASILADATPIRLSGQDVGRATFSQRHAVLHDAETGGSYVPLQHLREAHAAFEIHNSPLSENGVLGFEYGYTIQSPDTLVLWEAQYGDFVNGAQVIVDQFVASAKVKWGDTSGLVMLLPHGYEGAGPEHSSARLERFLELAAENNLRIAYPTTSAQYFHLLRRQAALLHSDPRPLVVMTPKSLLRHPLAASPASAFSHGAFQMVIDDDSHDRDRIERVLLCAGKVYVDMATSKLRADAHGVAIIRIEQLYPFPAAEIRAILDRYPNARDVAWVQEEPANMGSWRYMAPRLREMLDELGNLIQRPLSLRYIGRRERASPAEGSAAWHTAEQRRIVETALAPLTEDQPREVQHGD